MKENKIKKNFIWNTIGTTLNSFNSLFFLILVTRINGINDAGVFSFGFSLACVFYCIGNYSGRIYQVTERDSKYSNSDFIYTKILTCILMMGISIIYILLKGYVLDKILILLSLITFKMIEAFSESLYGIIQKNGDLYKVGISMLLKGVMALIVFFIIDYFSKNIILASFSLIIVNIIIVLFYDLKNVKEYKFKLEEFDRYKVTNILRAGFCTFLFTLLNLYVINAPKYAIDGLLSDKFQTIFGIIVMPATIMILCSQFLMHPFLVALTENLSNNDKKCFIDIVIKLSLGVFLIGIVGCIFAYFFGIPLLSFLYGIDLGKYLNCLLIIIVGATFFGVSYIISNALTSMRKTVSQVVVYIIVSIFSYFISRFLVNINGVFGASLSYFASMILLLILYLIIYFISLNKWRSNDG